MIRIVYEPEKGRSAAYDEDKNIGESTYSQSEKIWIIDHTFVEESYAGQGIASKLVEELVNQARKHETKIVPLCPYAKKEFDRKPEYQDVLSK